MLGKNISGLRAQLGLTQEELADRLDVTRSSVARWESGIDIPKMANLIELAKVFGVSLSELTNTKIDISRPQPAHQSAKQQKYQRFRRTFARGMAFASAIIVLGLSAMMFCFDQSTAMNKLSEIKQQCQQEYSNLIDRQNCTSEPSFQIMGELDVAAATGLVLLFSSTIIAMQFYIILGIQFRTLKPELVKEEHQIPEVVKAKINRSFPLQIAIGVCLVLIGIVEMIVVYGLGLAPRDSTFPVGVMFILMALAVFLFVYGGIQKSSINRDSKQLTAGQVKKRQLVDRLTGVIMLVATGVYLGFGFFIDSWGWLWPVFPIAAILCAILSVAMSPEED